MYILFDIGGTNMRFCLSEDGKDFDHVITAATPGVFDEAREQIGQLIESLGSQKVEHACGGVAGIVDEKGIITYAPNLSQWVGENLVEMLKDVCDAPVLVRNDALLGGLGEAVRGAGKGKEIVTYITVGTGVGGARIVGGKPDEYAQGFEPGHQIIDHEALLSLEEIVSGIAIHKTFDTDAEHVDEPRAWSELGKTFGVGIYNSVLHWSPDIVVIGGSVARKAPETFFDTARETYVALMDRSGRKAPPIAPGKLGDTPVLHGALELLKLEK